MNSPITAYRCKISSPNSKAWIKLGNKRRFVEVTEQSRESFTVRTTAKVAANIHVGMKFRLHHQDMLWSVCCKSKWLNEDGGIDLEVEQLAELTPVKVVQGSFFQRTKNISTSPMDGTLAFLLLFVLFVCILVMPAWGGQWGTSRLICNGVTAIWEALTGIVTGRTS